MEWDSKEWRDLRDKKLMEWFKGDKDAVQCLVEISTISEVWDDLIDRDVALTNAEISSAFVCATIKLPNNPFYASNIAALQPLIIMTVNAWMDSEELVKRSDKKSRMLAFYMRDIGKEIVPLIAFLVGGYAHMRKVSLEIKDFFYFDDYENWELRHVE